MKRTVTLVEGEHWEALYMDGALVVQAECVAAYYPLLQLGKRLGVEVDYVEVDEAWLLRRSGYPERLDDVVRV